METRNTSIWYNGLIWGLILGFVGVILGVIFYMLDIFFNPINQWGSIGISVIILIFAYLNFREKVLEGIMPFNKAFLFGFVAQAVSVVIGTIFFYLLLTVIDPDIHQKMIDMQYDKMLERGLSDAEIEQAMQITGRFQTPTMMTIWSLFGGLFFSALIALIMGAIFSKKGAEA